MKRFVISLLTLFALNVIFNLNRFTPKADSGIMYVGGVRVSQLVWTPQNEFRFTLNRRVSRVSFVCDGRVFPVNFLTHELGFYYYNAFYDRCVGSYGIKVGGTAIYRGVIGKGSDVVFVGDTDIKHNQLKRVPHTRTGTLVHLGDMSYASNNGFCYKFRASCVWNSTDPPPRTRKPLWEAFFSELDRITKHGVQLIQTPGNHDNDAPYRNKFNDPWFGEFLIGNVRVIKYCSEDNTVNAYERGGPFDEWRFDRHFGVSSDQYAFLRSLSPSPDKVTIVVSHRPLFHSSTHHRDGDWYGEHLRDLYVPELERIGTNYMIAGHSHHYEKTFPITYNNRTKQIEIDEMKGIVYIVNGIGGMKLEHGRISRPYVKEFSSDKFGYMVYNGSSINLVS